MKSSTSRAAINSSSDDLTHQATSEGAPATDARPPISSKPPLPQQPRRSAAIAAAAADSTPSSWKDGNSSPRGQPRHRTGHDGIKTDSPEGALATPADFIPTYQLPISRQFVNDVAMFDALVEWNADDARPTQANTSDDSPMSTSAIILSSLPVSLAVKRDADWRGEEKSAVNEAVDSTNSRTRPFFATSSVFELSSSASAAAAAATATSTELSMRKQRQTASARHRHSPFRHGAFASRARRPMLSAAAARSPSASSSFANANNGNFRQASPTSADRQVAPQLVSVNVSDVLRRASASRLTSADKSHSATVADRKWRATPDSRRRYPPRVPLNDNFSSSAAGGASWSDVSGSSSNPALRASASFDPPQRLTGDLPPPPPPTTMTTARASAGEAGETVQQPNHSQPYQVANTPGWYPPPTIPAILEAYGPDAWKPPPPPQPVTGGERDQALWYESHPPDMKSYAVFACCVLVACNALFGAVALVVVGMHARTLVAHIN
jgi:hypothetical protein